ncbi:MAG: fluoride efflux transporter CrcB [Candidatus Omnitrophica bacterium]|nr:fluoride efflux transporter CrcB [Candidatus Omnitrophota bacterium]
MIQNSFLVFVGGGAGAVARFLLSTAIQRVHGTAFPWGTLAVNLIGCFLIGMLWSLAGRVSMPFTFSIFLFAGVLGGFTTMSSFGLEAFSLFHDGAWRSAVVYILLTNLLGLGLTAAGFFITEFLFN